MYTHLVMSETSWNSFCGKNILWILTDDISPVKIRERNEYRNISNLILKYNKASFGISFFWKQTHYITPVL